jgi:hypothetical protein
VKKFKANGDTDFCGIFWPALTGTIGLTENLCWFLNFSEASLISFVAIIFSVAYAKSKRIDNVSWLPSGRISADPYWLAVLVYLPELSFHVINITTHATQHYTEPSGNPHISCKEISLRL